MSATLYSTLVPESELARRAVVIRVSHDKPVNMSAERQRMLVEAAWWTLDELERTRQLLAEVAPDLVRRFS